MDMAMYSPLLSIVLIVGIRLLANNFLAEKSATKRVRSNGKKRLLNRYQHKTARNYIRDFKEIGKIKEALKSFPKLVSNG